MEEALRGLPKDARILDLCTRFGMHPHIASCDERGLHGNRRGSSEKALQVAEKNGAQAGGRASFVKSNLFENIEGTFDVIASNPPYIRTDVIETLMPEVAATMSRGWHSTAVRTVLSLPEDYRAGREAI